MAANFDIDVKIEASDGIIKLFGSGPGTDHLIRDAMEDIAKEIESEAARVAPKGKTGKLKKHATERVRSTVGIAESRAPLFVKKGETPGTAFALRGPLGFVPGVGSAGKEVSHIEIGLPDDPYYAVWVHGGTGVFGQHGTPIVARTPGGLMVFHYEGRWHKRRTVQGQKAQPYLLEAYEYVDHTYVPKRVEELKAALAAIL